MSLLLYKHLIILKTVKFFSVNSLRLTRSSILDSVSTTAPERKPQPQGSHPVHQRRFGMAVLTLLAKATLIVLTATSARATTYYVANNGSGDSNYSNEANTTTQGLTGAAIPGKVEAESKPLTPRTSMATPAKSNFLSVVLPISSVEAGVSGESVIYTKDSSKYSKVHTSDIEKYDSNNIVTAWRAENSVNYHADSGDILFSYSSDGGSTWSTAGYLFQRNSSYQYGNVILFNNAGTIYAFVGRCSANDTNSELQKIVCKKSNDKGHTWTSVTLSNSYTNCTIIGGKIYKSGSNFLMPFHRNDNGTKIVGVLTSTNLTSWSLAGTVPNSTGIFLQEPFISCNYSDPNTLWMVMRAETGGLAYSSTSTNNGVTWTSAAVESSLPNYNAKSPVATTSEATKRYVYLYNDDANRNTLYYKTKLPSGSWTSGTLFADYGSNSDQYPMMIENTAGQYYTVSEYDYNKIIFRKLDSTTGGATAY